MDFSNLAEEWIDDHEEIVEMEADEIARKAFLAGVEAAQQRVQSDCAYCHCTTVILSDGVHCIECGRVYKSHSH